MHASPSRVAIRRVLALAVAVAATATACGGDDDTADATVPSTADGPTTTAPPTPVDDAGCDDFTVVTGQLMAGMVDPAEAPAVLDAFVASAPEAIADESVAMADGIAAMFAEDGDPLSDPAFTDALHAVGEHFFEQCDAAAKVDVTGIDYAFEGLPAEIDAGRLALRFTNGTELDEPHELLILRRPEGDTTPVGALATSDPEELMGTHEFIGVAFADTPGASHVTFVDLEPGSYVAICLLPTDGDESDPHAAHGMVGAFEVTS